MFATIEEAEKAAAMLRRFDPPATAKVVQDGLTSIWKVDPGPGLTYLWDWGQVADFLLERQGNPPEDERRKGLLTQAKAHLGVAQRLAEDQASMTADRCLIAALDCLLEALT